MYYIVSINNFATGRPARRLESFKSLKQAQSKLVRITPPSGFTVPAHLQGISWEIQDDAGNTVI